MACQHAQFMEALRQLGVARVNPLAGRSYSHLPRHFGLQAVRIVLYVSRFRNTWHFQFSLSCRARCDSVLDQTARNLGHRSPALFGQLFNDLERLPVDPRRDPLALSPRSRL
jgi:hypothetical protein